MAPGVPGAPGGATPYGLPGVSTVRDNLNDALNQVVARLTAFMTEVASLQVATYVSDRIQDVQYDPGSNAFTAGAQQRALTSIRLDGDTKACVPTDAGQIDQALWAVHTAMVQQAQANRAAMVKTAADALAGLLSVYTR
jgi:hypothetical protein